MGPNCTLDGQTIPCSVAQQLAAGGLADPTTPWWVGPGWQQQEFDPNCWFLPQTENIMCMDDTAIFGPLSPPSAGGADTDSSQGQTPAQECTGFGRGLGNTGALAGKQGGIPGVATGLGTAAVIPSQFGVPTGAALGPYAPGIFGTIGTASFSSVTDVIGGTSPIPGMNVRSALQQLFPGQLIVEIYGARDQGVNAPVLIQVPAGLGCPTGTSPAVLGDPVTPPSGSPVPAVARRIR